MDRVRQCLEGRKRGWGRVGVFDRVFDLGFHGGAECVSALGCPTVLSARCGGRGGKGEWPVVRWECTRAWVWSDGGGRGGTVTCANGRNDSPDLPMNAKHKAPQQQNICIVSSFVCLWLLLCDRIIGCLALASLSTACNGGKGLIPASSLSLPSTARVVGGVSCPPVSFCWGSALVVGHRSSLSLVHTHTHSLSSPPTLA